MNRAAADQLGPGHLALVFAVLAGIVVACRPGHESGQGGDSPAVPPHEPRAETLIRFTDVAAARGVTRILQSGGPEKLLILENVGTGAALFDADGDGRLDIFLANAGRLEGIDIAPGPGTALYVQTETGSFEDRTQSSGLAFQGWGTGAAAADIDNDGDADLLLTCFGRNRLYRNRGQGTFEEVSENMGIDDDDFSTSAVFLDYDADGFLDFYVVNYVELDLRSLPNGGQPCLQRGVPSACGPGFYRPAADRLYRNDAGERFHEVTDAAGMTQQPGGYGLGVVATDLDDDGWSDLYVANDSTANFLWRNRGGGKFDEVAFVAGAALSETGQGQAGMGVDAADADGDGRPDLFVTNYAEEYFTYYRNLGGAYFEDASHEAGLARETYMSLGWGVKWTDVDNDGDLDLLVTNGHVYPQAPRISAAARFFQPSLLYRNDGPGGFIEIGRKAGADVHAPRAHRGLAVGDIDNDGDVDCLLTVLDGPAVLLENRSLGAGNWIRVRLRGTRSNREGIGACVDLFAGGRRQRREVTRGGSYLSSHDVRLHFGIGRARQIDRLTVRWPSRVVESFATAGINKEILITEGQGERVTRKERT